MTAGTVQTIADGREIRCIQALDADPLFDGARYTFSVEGGGEGYEIVVAVSPYFVHLLPLAVRRRLEALAADALVAALESGVSGSEMLRISADGRLMAAGRDLATLLPLVRSRDS